MQGAQVHTAGPQHRGHVPQSHGLAQAVRGDTSYLPSGWRLGELELLGLVGPGRSGPVYRALDLDSGQTLVVKEFMPAGLATRFDWQVGPLLPEQQADFDAASSEFVQDASWLAHAGHPALLPVLRVWPSHGTACATLPLAAGGTLLAHLARYHPARTAPGETGIAAPNPEWLQRLLSTLADGLQCLHAAGRLHRALSPGKVLFTAQGRPQLLALGLHPLRASVAAPGVARGGVRPGFAPIESYPANERGQDGAADLTEGPWTDMYALGALAYTVITGAAPRPAPQRGFGDTAAPLVRLARGRYDERLLDAIDRALAVWPAERPQSGAEFLEMAGLSEPVYALGAPQPESSVGDGSGPAPESPQPESRACDETQPDAQPAPRPLAAPSPIVARAPMAKAAASAPSVRAVALLERWRHLAPAAAIAAVVVAVLAAAGAAVMLARAWLSSTDAAAPVSLQAPLEPELARRISEAPAALAFQPAAPTPKLAAAPARGGAGKRNATRPRPGTANDRPANAAPKNACADLLAQLSMGATPSPTQLERLKAGCP